MSIKVQTMSNLALCKMWFSPGSQTSARYRAKPSPAARHESGLLVQGCIVSTIRSWTLYNNMWCMDIWIERNAVSKLDVIYVLFKLTIYKNSVGSLLCTVHLRGSGALHLQFSVTMFSTDCLNYSLILYRTHSQMLGKFEYTRGPILDWIGLDLLSGTGVSTALRTG